MSSLITVGWARSYRWWLGSRGEVTSQLEVVIPCVTHVLWTPEDHGRSCGSRGHGDHVNVLLLTECLEGGSFSLEILAESVVL